MLDSPEAQFAIEAVREASLLARRIQREMVTGALTKDDRSPVTVADFAVQALIARRLAEQLPGSALIGEEQADSAATRRRHRNARPNHRFRPFRDSRRHAGRSLRPDRPRQRRAAASFLDARPDRRHQGLPAPRAICGRPGASSKRQSRTRSPRLPRARRRFNHCTSLFAGQGDIVAQPLDKSARLEAPLQSRREPVRSEARILRSVEKSHTNVDEIGQLAAKLGVTARAGRHG